MRLRPLDGRPARHVRSDAISTRCDTQLWSVHDPGPRRKTFETNKIMSPRFLAPAALLFGLATACLAAADDHDPQLVAKVAGKEVTQAELEELLATQLAQLDRQRQQLLEQGVGPLVERKLLEHEAEVRGTSLEEMVQAEIDAKSTEITDAEAEAWYEQNRSRLRGTKDQLMPQIQTFLSQQQASEIRQAFVADLQKKYEVQIFFEPYREDLGAEGATVKGAEDAPVTIVEFSDFQCPACRGFNPILTDVQNKYGDKVRIVFRQFPLRSIHPQAQKAAEASLCAKDQGKFWEIHDKMFGNQGNLAISGLKQMAEELELDMATFNECLDSGQYAGQVAEDLQIGENIGVSGTPAVFVNGRVVAPGRVPSLEMLSNVIDEELLRADR